MEYNPRIHVKKDKSRSAKAADIRVRGEKLPIAVTRPSEKGSRRHRVRDTQIGRRPIDAWQPPSTGSVVR